MNPEDAALVDRFLDMMAAEAGSSRHTLAAYRNDLERAAQGVGGSLGKADTDALAGLGRIDADTANSLNRRHGLGLSRQSSWTRMIDAAAGRGQAGTVLVLTGTGFQTSRPDQLPAAHMFHAITSLHRTGQDFTARMIAAEALSRT